MMTELWRWCTLPHISDYMCTANCGTVVDKLSSGRCCLCLTASHFESGTTKMMMRTFGLFLAHVLVVYSVMSPTNSLLASLRSQCYLQCGCKSTMPISCLVPSRRRQKHLSVLQHVPPPHRHSENSLPVTHRSHSRL